MNWFASALFVTLILGSILVLSRKKAGWILIIIALLGTVLFALALYGLYRSIEG